MKRNSFFLICFMLGLLRSTAADPGILQGVVKDASTDDPVAGVIVKAKGAFATTDRAGRFMLKLKGETDSVTFRCIGYESLTVAVTVDLAEVRLSPKVTRLRDVIVAAPDIYAKGDTLVFNVERYANSKDNAIIDVIKRLPGIKVDDDGTIKYQGKPINKFYLDGNDFIGGRYGLATNNISHKDVKSVEVMENHQPVKALEGIEFPEEAGINLKLKDDARSRWVGVMKAAAGVEPLLYDGSVFTMRMAPRVQNMFTLKVDNTGWNPVNEIREHGMDIMFSSGYKQTLWPDFITADIVNLPLSEKRTRDNRSWLADAITGWKSGETSMRFKVDYIGDRLDYNSGVSTDYFSSHIPTFIQNNNQRTQNHDLTAKFSSETNKREYYLTDHLTLSGNWKESNSEVTGSWDLAQIVDRNKFSGINDLKLVKRNDKKLFTLTSRNSLTASITRLTVKRTTEKIERLGATDFRSTTEIRSGRLTRFWKYYLTAGVDLDFHRLNASLSGFGSLDNRGIHRAFLSDVYATPQADYERNGWRLSLSMPVKWLHYAMCGRYDYVNISPGVRARRKLTAKSELTGSIAYMVGAPQPYLDRNLAILTDYRSILITGNPGKYTQDIVTAFSYRYRNPVKAMFVNMTATYNFRRSSTMLNQLFVDDYIISTFTRKLLHNDTWNFKGGVSKGLGHSKIVIGVEGDASLSSASSMRDNTVIPYKQTAVGVRPYFKGSILRWLSANYEAEYGYTRLNIDGERNNFNSFRQNIFATLIPNDLVNFTIGGEEFVTRLPKGNTTNVLLLDASAVCKPRGKVRLSLTANNLLNKRRYEYVSYGTLSRSEHSFNIRGRSILASIQYQF